MLVSTLRIIFFTIFFQEPPKVLTKKWNDFALSQLKLK
ncbi:unnamed protein product [Spirodela intermedia]|uniref:Uncharacterized protein n=1 Tax=Spirodela intermedia TaxID=51605 RepID=A0A7I8KDV9_SPIIN|nr:unnamed protein product [Spirodela intermedia]